MDSEHRRILRENEYRMKSLNIDKLKPSLLYFKIFTSAMLNHITNCKELFRELATRGPDAFENFIKVLQEQGYKTEAVALERCALPDPKIGSYTTCDTYKISSNPLGYCLIINNVNFKNSEEELGSYTDAQALLEIFKEIGYSVQPEKNLTLDGMKSALKEFSEQDFSQVDSSIVIILSHGTCKNNLDVIYGTDCRCISKYDILKYFSDGSCKTLHMKPKLFFILTYTGKIEDHDVLCNNMPLPPCSDIFIVYSSLHYNECYNKAERSSWLCKYLVEVLRQEYCIHDLETMMKSVNKKVMKRIPEEWKTKEALDWEYMAMSKSIRFFANIASKKFS